MTDFPQFTLAAIQAAPVYLDREASTEKACQLIEQAARQGADLAAFSETWLTGYPFFYPYPIQTPPWNQAMAAYLANGVEIPSPTTDRLCEAAHRAGIDVVIGLVELDANTRGTVYCTLLFIGREGQILGRHRKLKPTLAERMLWGEGDGIGLRVYERPYGRISGLCCGEHAMMLPGYALMAQGTQVHVAAWPYSRHIADSSPVNGLLMSRAFAAQGNCFVIAAGGLLRPEDVPEAQRDLVRQRVFPPGEGGSCIIAPGGKVIATAPADEETILTATVSLETVLEHKAAIDVGAHYSRPDVLQLHLNRRPLERLVEQSPADS
ncbi:MAG: carbon-nitrogen hydrolase family protein [Chloroflexota bacterium]